jgi:hypothetical protein
MPWFRVDDNLALHPKVLAAGNTAMGMWVRAGAWSAQQLTDGFVGDDLVKLLGKRPLADRLVAAGLWVPQAAGFQFHEWSTDGRQPTKEMVLTERRASAARAKVARSPELRASIRRRDGDRCRYCAVKVLWNDRRGGTGGTYDPVLPDGPSDVENLVVCCRACNSSKGRRTPEQAGMTLIQVGPKSGPISDPGCS